MIDLLVSVSNAKEAIEAMKGGADIIDVKNPLEGSLGASYPSVIFEIVSTVQSKREVSAAIGDAMYKPGTYSLAAFGVAHCDVDYIKVGLHHITTAFQGVQLVSNIVKAARMVDQTIKIVTAGYADADRVQTLSPMLLPSVAEEAGASVVMIDTAIKDGKGLFDFLSAEDLHRFIDKSRELGLQVALAGSLKPAEMHRIRELKPDIVGVRGAVCDGDRVRGSVRAEKVAVLRNLLT